MMISAVNILVFCIATALVAYVVSFVRVLSKNKLDNFKKYPEKFTLEDGVRWYRNFAGSQYYFIVPWITDSDLLTRVNDFNFFEKLKFLVNDLPKVKQEETARGINESISMLVLGLEKLKHLHELASPALTKINYAERNLKVLEDDISAIKKPMARAKALKTVENQNANLLFAENKSKQHQQTIDTFKPRAEAILKSHSKLQADILNIMKGLESLLISNLSVIATNEETGRTDEELLLIYRSQVENSLTYGAAELDEYLVPV